jgi:hypothetical protein
MYIIKVYRIKNLVKDVNKTWTLEYVSTLPYRFKVKPINICNQLNEMFEESFEHVIDVE